MHACTRCAAHSLSFNRHYAPAAFLEGSPDSRIWIVGLNPAVEPQPECEALAGYFGDRTRLHSYFRDFAIVSPRLFEMLGEPGGVAHTDLIKCSSKRWPPPQVSPKARREIIANCEPYLVEQIRSLRPSVILCNGAEVSAAIQRVLPPVEAIELQATSYRALVENHEIHVVLSGFIGRIDNFAKRRLGREIEELIRRLGIWI